MEEKSQVVERETKKDEIHEKDGKSKRWATVHSILKKHLLYNVDLMQFENARYDSCECKLWMAGNTVSRM